MAPLVVKGKVLVGNSGGEFGVRGWLTALDAKTGKLAWRAYHTGPDKDVLIGARFQAVLRAGPGQGSRRHHLAGRRVEDRRRRRLGLDLLRSRTRPDLLRHRQSRALEPRAAPGDNKWTAGMFARDPDTGEAVWAYQWSPHDLFDHDGINEQILLDLPINGQTRKVLVRPERNGYIYVLDRTTGEVLSADPYGYITTSKGVDLKTGRPIYVPEKAAADREGGAGDLPGGSRDARTGSRPPSRRGPACCTSRTRTSARTSKGVEANYIAGTPYVGANVKMYAGPGGNRGRSPPGIRSRGKPSGRSRRSSRSGAARVVTAGDVVFYGTMEGWFKALDARSGTELWQFKTGSGIIGQPIVYRGPDGKEYVAVLSGVGGWAGAVVAGGLDIRDSSAALGFVNAMKDLPQAPPRAGCCMCSRCRRPGARQRAAGRVMRTARDVLCG